MLPCLGHPSLMKYDDLLRQGLQSIVMSKHQWLQATLPINEGGLGIRRVASLASSAYLASAAATLGLLTSILAAEGTPSDDFVDEFMEFRKDTLPTTDAFQPVKLKIWDRPLIHRDLAEITEHAEELSINQTIGLTCKLSSVRMTLMHRKKQISRRMPPQNVQS